MVKNKKAGKQVTGTKRKLTKKNKNVVPDQDQIISKIEEDSRVLKGIISRFSKPLTKNDE